MTKENYSRKISLQRSHENFAFDVGLGNQYIMGSSKKKTYMGFSAEQRHFKVMAMILSFSCKVKSVICLT